MQQTTYSLKASVPLTIAVVADLHQHNPSPVLDILRTVRPDVIAVPGDLLERHKHGENLDRFDKSFLSRLICRGIHLADKLFGLRRFKSHDVKSSNSYRFLQEASEIAPVIMCLGNHELYLTEKDLQVLEETGTQLLHDNFTEIKGVLFGGIPSRQNSGTINEEFLKSFAGSDHYKVLLCHHPEYYTFLSEYGFDLVISGHCHGGQIRLLGHGLFGPGQGILPKYHHGIYRVSGKEGCMVVSSGCANTAAIPRWGNEEEVVVITLS